MKMKSRFGVAADWPFDYAELEPYYVEAEEMVGVAGPAAQGTRWRSAYRCLLALCRMRRARWRRARPSSASAGKPTAVPRYRSRGTDVSRAITAEPATKAVRAATRAAPM